MEAGAARKSGVVRSGWLRKRGVNVKNWRPRYFVLRDDGRFLGFRMTQADPAADPPAEPPNNDFTVRDCCVSESDRPTPFAFAVRGLQLTTVVVRHFQADTEEDRREWVDAIRDVKRKLDEEDRGKQEQETPKAKHKVVTLGDFDFLKVLGRGSYGKVILCREKRTDRLHAVKILKKEAFMNREEGDGAGQAAYRERNVLQRTKHPFLLHLRYSFTTADHLCLVTEYVNGGDLYFHLSNEGQFSEAKTRFYGAEIVSAIGYLHELGIIYRDLKVPRGIFNDF